MDFLNTYQVEKGQHALKAASSGLAVQQAAQKTLLSLRTNPLAHRFWSQLLAQQNQTIRSIALIHNKPLASHLKPDIHFQLQNTENQTMQDIFLSHKNIHVESPISALAQLITRNDTKLWEEHPFLLEDFLLAVLKFPIHAQHHAGRIHFQKAQQYALFSSHTLYINATLLEHFVESNPLWQQEPSVYHLVMEHLNAQRKTIIQSIVQGLKSEPPSCTHMSLSVSTKTPQSSDFLKNPTYIKLDDALRKQRTFSQSQWEERLQFLQKTEHPLWQHIDSVALHFSHIHSNFSWHILYYQLLVQLFVDALQIPSNNHPTDLDIVFLSSCPIQQIIDTLSLLPWQCSTPTGIEQLGVIGNSWVHIQRGKSLSRGAQTDLQVKVNAHFILLYACALHKGYLTSHTSFE